MSAFIDELKQEHLLFVAMLNKVKELGITTPDGQAKLLEIQTALLSHIHIEDTRLYPALRSAALTQAELKNILAMFDTEMNDIAQTAAQFFSKYAGGGTGTEFGQDFGRLSGLLTHRIWREENILFPEYEKL